MAEEGILRGTSRDITCRRLIKSDPYHFYDVEYTIADGIVKDKKKVTVRFEATKGSRIAAVFGIRMIRADAER